MPVSSLFLRSESLAKLAVLSLLFAGAVAPAPAASSYVLDVEYTGDSFFSNFDFYTGADASNGFVSYLGYQDALDYGLIATDYSGVNYMGVDSSTVINPNGPGREATRLVSQQEFTHGLFILELENMPGGVCGTSPGFYTQGTNGDIKVIGARNNDPYNLMSLVTTSSYNLAGSPELGALQSTACDSPYGCSVLDNYDQSSFGNNFNNNNGGTFALRWESNILMIWFFEAGTEPSDITNGAPNPNGWGTPVANFAGDASIDSIFQNNKIVFDTSFCGTWINTYWSSSSYCAYQAPTCADFVGLNPDAFSEMYWAIVSLKVYQIPAVVSSSSTSVSSTSSTSTAASSTTSTSETSISTTSSASSSSSSVALSTSSSSVSTSSSIASSSSTSSQSSTSSTSSAGPTATLPAYFGCVEDISSRLLYDSHTAYDSMTVESCASDCSGYTYFGLEYGRECYCGNSFAITPIVVPDNECYMACDGDSTEFCGGPMLLSVYGPPLNIVSSSSQSGASTSSSASVSAASSSSISTSSVPSTTTSTSPTTTGVLSPWQSLGCWAETAEWTDGRTLDGSVHYDYTGLTVEECEGLCQADGYAYAGVEYGGECYCGSAPSELSYCGLGCNVPCPGNSSETCGGENRLDIYYFNEGSATPASICTQCTTDTNLPFSTSAPTSTTSSSAPITTTSTSSQSSTSSAASTTSSSMSSPSSTSSIFSTTSSSTSSGSSSTSSPSSTTSSTSQTSSVTTSSVSNTSSVTPTSSSTSSPSSTSSAVSSPSSTSSSTFSSMSSQSSSSSVLSSTSSTATSTSSLSSSSSAVSSPTSSQSSSSTLPATGSTSSQSSTASVSSSTSLASSQSSTSSTTGTGASSTSSYTSSSSAISSASSTSSQPSSSSTVDPVTSSTSSQSSTSVVSSSSSTTSYSSSSPLASSSPSVSSSSATQSSVSVLSSTSSIATPVTSTAQTSSSVAGATTPTPSPSTETIYSTSYSTISSCAPGITNCPFIKTATLIPVSTIIYPTTSPSPTTVIQFVSVYPLPSLTTSTVYATTVYTITSCAATVTDCPARIGQVTTETVELYTTVCPVTATETSGVTTGETGGVSNPAQSEFITTVVVTTYTDICPGGLTTIATSQTLTVPAGGPSPTIPVITTVKSLTISGTLTTATLTVPFVATTPASQTTGFKGNVGQFASSSSSPALQPVTSALSPATAKVLSTTSAGYPISTVSTTFYPAGNATSAKAGSTSSTLVYVPASTQTHLGASAGGKFGVSFGVVGVAFMIVAVGML